MENIENDILLEGIIKYTKENKLIWSKNIIGFYSTIFKIENSSKYIHIGFSCKDSKNFNTGSYIDISIKISKNRIRTYKYINYNKIRKDSFLELFNLIESHE